MRDSELRDAERVWRGSGVEEDWRRWAVLMWRSGRPGPLELFRACRRVVGLHGRREAVTRLIARVEPPLDGLQRRRLDRAREVQGRAEALLNGQLRRAGRAYGEGTRDGWLPATIARRSRDHMAPAVEVSEWFRSGLVDAATWLHHRAWLAEVRRDPR